MKRRAIKEKTGTVKIQFKWLFWWFTVKYFTPRTTHFAEKLNWFVRHNVEKVNF